MKFHSSLPTSVTSWFMTHCLCSRVLQTSLLVSKCVRAARSVGQGWVPNWGVSEHPKTTQLCCCLKYLPWEHLPALWREMWAMTPSSGLWGWAHGAAATVITHEETLGVLGIPFAIPRVTGWWQRRPVPQQSPSCKLPLSQSEFISQELKKEPKKEPIPPSKSSRGSNLQLRWSLRALRRYRSGWLVPHHSHPAQTAFFNLYEVIFSPLPFIPLPFPFFF